MSTQLSPVKAAFLFPHTVANGVDLVFCPTSAAYFVESCEKSQRKKKRGITACLILTETCVETHDPMRASCLGGCTGWLCREPLGCFLDTRVLGAGPQSSSRPSVSCTVWLLQTGRNHVTFTQKTLIK